MFKLKIISFISISNEFETTRFHENAAAVSIELACFELLFYFSMKFIRQLMKIIKQFYKKQ